MGKMGCQTDRNSSCDYPWNETQHGSCHLEHKDFRHDKGLYSEFYQPTSSN